MAKARRDGGVDRGERSAKAATTRRRILAATARVLIDNGYGSTRLTDIAELAEVRAGSIYYYFDSKEDLVEEVLRQGVQLPHAHVRAAVEALPAGASAGRRLETAVSAQIEVLLDLGEMASAHVRAFSQAPATVQGRVRPLRRAFGRYWSELVGDAVAAGELRDDADPYVVQLFLTTSIERIIEWPRASRRSTADLSRLVCGFLFEGVRPVGA